MTEIGSTPSIPPDRFGRVGGAAPEYWNVPLRRARCLVDRRETLTEINDYFERDAGVHIQAISGLPGSGKTHLAAEYCFTYAALYDVVWWVRASHPLTAEIELMSLGKEVGLAPQPHHPVTVKSLHRWLRGTRRYLLVFDDVVEPDSVIELTPSAGRGDVLITTQRTLHHTQIGRSLNLNLLTAEQGAALLAARTGQACDEYAVGLVANLDGLPLALDQAATFIARAGVLSYRDYLKMLVGEQQSQPSHAGEGRTRLGSAVQASLQLAMVRLQEHQGPTPLILLELLSYFGSSQLPWQVLAQPAAPISELLRDVIKDTIGLADAIAELRDWSLIATEGETISIHSVVQRHVRSGLTREAAIDRVTSALTMLELAFPSPSWRLGTSVGRAQLLPHLLTTCSLADDLRLTREPRIGRLLRHASAYLRGRMQYADAVSLADKALSAHSPSRLSFDSPDEIANDLVVAALALRAQGHTGIALQKVQEALHATEGDRNYSPLDYARIGCFAGVLLFDTDAFDQAERMLREALQIHSTGAAKSSLFIATDRHNLGRVLGATGRQVEARHEYEEALRMYEGELGTEHPHVAASRHNLGMLLREDDWQKACDYVQDALAIHEATLGPHHPHTGVDSYSLGALAEQSGDLQLARQRYQRCASLHEALFGPKHPHAFQANHAIARVTKSVGDRAPETQDADHLLDVVPIGRLPLDHFNLDLLVVDHYAQTNRLINPGPPIDHQNDRDEV